MKKSLQFLGLLASLWLFPGFLQAQFSLEEVLGAPYTESLNASPDGEHLAWVVNEKGVRNIWYTPVSAVAPRQVSGYSEDDGLAISLEAVLPDFLFYVRGNGPNRSGEPANPASLPGVPEQKLIRIRLSDGRIDTLASASGAHLSPDRKALLFSRGKQVYLLKDITGPEPQTSLLFEVRAGVGSLSWSPDGSRIAFVSPRTDHSFIGVYSLETHRLRWIAPGLGFDEYPAWAPDGKRIAFLRRPGRSQGELRDLTGGNPFELMVGDADTGQAQSIWKSPADDGGFAQYYPNAPLRWTPGNRLLFYSEHQGWNHLYAIRPDGSGLTDLTPGACETEDSNLSPDGRYLYSSSNCGDLNRRHLWRTDLERGKSEQITGPEGIQTHAVGLAGEVLAYREGGYNQPTTAVLQKQGEQTVLGPQGASFPKGMLQKPGEVRFTAPDGLEIHGQLFAPPPGAKKKYPAVIFMHGGPIRQMLLGYHFSGYYANAYSMNQYLASRGYVVLSVNFRSGTGYGRAFRRAPNQGPRGASEYQDILAAARYLQSLPEVDPEAIGLWGGSYGGYLTAMGLARNSDLFKAGVDLHGVHDWAWRGREFSPGGGWGLTEGLMEQALASSPVSDLGTWKSPVLLISGDDDRNVMIGQSIDLKNRLDALGVYNEVLVFPDEVHGFLRHDSWLQAYEATASFFDRFLKGMPPRD
ncbi:S9 family peptidase [Robiginitalea marina]|uniref:Acyl-peptide hydrolase n=1 Tax=Robiginitalea marina TaxID=2954105 RepID=A0ABT1AZ57_9FLAO|nr:prolyl oligopeptidase family serine peptidase [Robiginitalea marina]MCO5725329.1 prolyl oligopeptidase family serine peptidase [Robiginitalea marina]